MKGRLSGWEGCDLRAGFSHPVGAEDGPVEIVGPLHQIRWDGAAADEAGVELVVRGLGGGRQEAMQHCGH